MNSVPEEIKKEMFLEIQKMVFKQMMEPKKKPEPKRQKPKKHRIIDL